MDALIEKLNGLEGHLKTHIKGQDHILTRITSVLKRGALGIAHPDRPRGSFLLVGPTGTGKTEITLTFTDYFFGKGHLVRFDMSEFMTPSSVGRLIGEREGEIGLLGQKLKGLSQGTLLFDEMEKAEPRILDLFLQILDAGRITLGNHETLSLNNFYLVFTSNIGSSEIKDMVRSPFSTIERVVMNQVKETLRPELVGRITEKLVFNTLKYDVQVEICKDMIEKELRRLARMGFSLSYSDAVLSFLINVGYNRSLGARPMRDAVEKHFGDLVVSQTLRRKATSGRIVVNKTRTSLLLEEEPEEQPSSAFRMEQEPCFA